MPLKSKLFQDDAALQACLVKDSAHVTQGARGAHVGKIQAALFTLEGALIDEDELDSEFYGPSTADAVLEYKKKRDIVNRSYQQRADNIVGKMTIATLDREIAAGEQRKPPPSCEEPSSGPAAPPRGDRRDLVGDAPPEQFPAILSVLFQLVRAPKELGPQSFPIVRETVRRANEIVAPIGMRVASIAGFSFSAPRKLNPNEPEDVDGLRRGAENAMGGFKAALRVIVCPFRKPFTDDDDLETNAISWSTKGFDRFMVINSNLLRNDRVTLLHEMIHCSSPGLMGEDKHDPITSPSVFSWNGNRSVLHPHHAKSLRLAFFSFPR